MWDYYVRENPPFSSSTSIHHFARSLDLQVLLASIIPWGLWCQCDIEERLINVCGNSDLRFHRNLLRDSILWRKLYKAAGRRAVRLPWSIIDPAHEILRQEL